MTTRVKYWKRADLTQLSDDLDEIDTVPVGVLNALRRLIDEVENLNMQVEDLWGERR